MSRNTDAPRNYSHPESRALPAFALCLLFGPFGLLYFGIIETMLVGSVFLGGLALSYRIWEPMFPWFTGISFLLLAFTAKRAAGARFSGSEVSDSERSAVNRSIKRTLPMAAAVTIDLGLLCIGEAVLKELWMGYYQMHILGLILSLCITLPIGIYAAHSMRKEILRRIFR